MKTPIEPQTAFASEARRKYVNKETGKPENHDRAWAGEIRLPAGGRVWAAIVADGCGGDSRGTQVAEACVAAFRAAVAGSSAAELCDIVRAKAWAARWGDALQATIVDGPLKGGNSTLAAAVAVRDPASPAAFSLLLVNVGDSPMFLYSGPELRALNVRPDEPEDNPNAGAGGNGLRRAIGLPATGAFPLFDVAIRRLPADAGPCGVAVFSDGVTDYTKVAVQGGRKTLRKLKLLNPSDFRRVLADGSPFADRAAAILAVSLATARARGIPETQMDNSSVALLGFGLDRKIRVPGVRPVDRRRSALFVAAAAAFVAVGCLLAALWPRVPKKAEMGGGAFVEDGRPPISQPFRTNAVHRTNLLPAPVPPSATNHPAAPSATNQPAAPAVTNEPAKPAPSLRGLPNEARVGESPSSVVQHSPPNVPTVPPAPNASPVPPATPPAPNASPVPPATPPATTNAPPLNPAPSAHARPVAAAKSAQSAVQANATDGESSKRVFVVNSTTTVLVVEGLGDIAMKIGQGRKQFFLPESGLLTIRAWAEGQDRSNVVTGFLSQANPTFKITENELFGKNNESFSNGGDDVKRNRPGEEPLQPTDEFSDENLPVVDSRYFTVLKLHLDRLPMAPMARSAVEVLLLGQGDWSAVSDLASKLNASNHCELIQRYYNWRKDEGDEIPDISTDDWKTVEDIWKDISKRGIDEANVQPAQNKDGETILVPSTKNGEVSSRPEGSASPD